MSKSLPGNFRKVYLYYLLYCFIFVLFDLAFISVFSFFHFLLEHDMNIIENWLNRNTWEIITLSKVSALLLSSRILKLNLADDLKFRHFFLSHFKWPTIKIWGLVFFLSVIFYGFVNQLGGTIDQAQFKEEYFYSSFIGAFFFYIADFVILYIILKVYPVEFKSQYKLIWPCLFLFILSSKLALPYLSKYYVFFIVHFITIYIFITKDNLSDIFVYSFFIIAPLSSIYGLDIVWGNEYSLFSYERSLPALGVLAIWAVSLSYYRLSRVD